MEKQIKITKRNGLKGEDGYKVVSVRIPCELTDALDKLADETNRSRNDLINILLKEALALVVIEE